MSHDGIYLLIIIIVVVIMIAVAWWFIKQQQSDYHLYFTNNTTTNATLRINYAEHVCYTNQCYVNRMVKPNQTVKINNPEVRIDIIFTSSDAFNKGINFSGVKYIGRHNYAIYSNSWYRTIYPDEIIDTSNISITKLTVNNNTADSISVNLGTLSDSTFTTDTNQRIAGNGKLIITNVFELAAIDAKNTPCTSTTRLAYQLIRNGQQVGSIVPFTITDPEVVICINGDYSITGSGFTICTSS